MPRFSVAHAPGFNAAYFVGWSNFPRIALVDAPSGVLVAAPVSDSPGVYNAPAPMGGATPTMKHFTLLLVAVLMFNSVAVAQATQTQEASLAIKVKADLQRRGVGEKSRVKVRRRNKAEVKGYISKIE